MASLSLMCVIFSSKMAGREANLSAGDLNSTWEDDALLVVWMWSFLQFGFKLTFFLLHPAKVPLCIPGGPTLVVIPPQPPSCWDTIPFLNRSTGA